MTRPELRKAAAEAGVNETGAYVEWLEDKLLARSSLCGAAGCEHLAIFTVGGERYCFEHLPPENSETVGRGIAREIAKRAEAVERFLL